MNWSNRLFRWSEAVGNGMAIVFGLVCIGCIGSCWYGFRYYEDMTERIIACKTIDEARALIQPNWRCHEYRFERDGKRHTVMSIHIRPPTGVMKPLAFKQPAIAFDENGRAIDHCIREYDDSPFRNRWREAYRDRAARAAKSPSPNR